MAEVEVIKASEGTVSRRRYEGTGLKLERKKVAAYVRYVLSFSKSLNYCYYSKFKPLLLNLIT
jgi:hypothetical protein